MLGNANLQKLRDFRSQMPVEGPVAKRATVTPKIVETASGGAPRPKKSRFKTKDILREGPSTDVCGTVWGYAHSKVKKEDMPDSSGYYIGDRWSPAPSARNWQKQRFAIK